MCFRKGESKSVTSYVDFDINSTNHVPTAQFAYKEPTRHFLALHTLNFRFK